MIRVIDIESTGINPAEGEIIEIASVDMVKGGGIANAMQSFVKPKGSIPPLASAVHHILDQDVVDAPFLHQAIEQFKGADFYVSHNSDFESSFFEANEIDLGSWVCTYKCALRVWPEFEGHKNQELRYLLGLATPFGYVRAAINPHRAASDVIVTAAIFEKLLASAAWSDLVDWSKEPALHTRLHFGKHRGQRYSDVDPSYLEWCLGQKDMDANVKYSAKHWLAKREVPA